MLRILANDGMSASAADHLRGLGHEVVTEFHDIDQLKEKLGEFDAIIIRSATKIRKELIDVVKETKLKLIVRAGVGIDNIDYVYARENGIEVRNTPNSSSASVAELTIAHMFAVARHVHASNVTLRNGEWNKKHYVGTEIAGKTLGLIGFGRIAREVAKRALVLGMKVQYTDIVGAFDGMPECEYVHLDDIIKHSDYISLHIPFEKAKGPVITKTEFDKMKEGVYIINCARGGVIDEADLLDCLNTGKIAGAGIDVFAEEPTKNLELVQHARVSATPHIGAATTEAQDRIGVETYETILGFFGA
jgi:D-3-phosphoglycerate dehydrogenase